MTSWSLFQPEEDDNRATIPADDHAILDDDDLDIEAAYDSQDSLSLRRKSTAPDASASDRLIQSREAIHDSPQPTYRTSQTIYIPTEDLTIAVTGFKTSRIGHMLYLIASSLTLGLGWLLFRWFPRTRVRLIGTTCPLGECDWVIVEVYLYPVWRLRT